MNRHEFDLQYKGLVSGSDEVGRGSMAGPEVVASVILKKDYFNPLCKDSKQLTKEQREKLFDEIIENSVAYSIREYSAEYVDEHNPLQTSINGMAETINDLTKVGFKPDISLIDGNQHEPKTNGIKFINLIKGDNKSQSIAAASILAKVYHDRIMKKLAEKYPEYSFEKHVGYCTKDHIAKVNEYGIIKGVHRESYGPIKKAMLNGVKYHK